MPSEQEIKGWYNKRYAAKGVDTMRPYDAYPIFLDYLEAQEGKKLLDIGCGTGFLLRAASLKGLETFGVDVSEEAIKLAKKVSPKSFISVGKGENLKFEDNAFDYITCLGSLEHFLDMKKAIKEMKSVAKDNALFCIMVPNSNYFQWKISGKPGTNQQDINENLLSLKQWKTFFIEEKFEILNIYQDKWFMKKINIFSSKNLIKIIKKIINKLAWFFCPLSCTYQFVFILKKR
ncbi:methylase involved in ubiquinone/menaquinone biosynthesis [Thermoplasmatales archaeon SCGC AB-539-C06]|nr:methylase involved in ubiquinone/menaquinone biosynthesis [Thermoplasmatales archaeon SCGC AB-539-C06]